MMMMMMSSSSSSSLQVPYLECNKEEDMVSMISHVKVSADLHSNGTSTPWQQPAKVRRVVQLKKNMRYKGVVTLPNGHHGAQIYTNHQRIWLGTFKTDIDAAMAYDSASIKLRSDDLNRNFPCNSRTALEPAFQSHLSNEAVLSMIKDGTYQSRFEDYLRNYQHADSASTMDLGTSPGHGYNAKGGSSSCQQLFQKELTLSDVGKLNRLVIPKKFATRHFPRLCDGMDSQPVTLYDRQIKPWTFRYCYWKSSQSFVFTRGWNRFVKEKQLKAGHVITFYKCEVVKGTGEIKTVIMIDDDGKDNNLWFLKRLEELEVRQAAPPLNCKGVRLFGVQIG